MPKYAISIFIMLTFLILYPLEPGFSQSRKKTPWSQRHFPNAPRITAEQAMQIKLSGQKVILIDSPWSPEDFNKGHICGAVTMGIEADELDKKIKKIPKDYVILAY